MLLIFNSPALKRKILVTGANGQLGSSLKKLQHNDPELLFTYTDIDDLDITNLQNLDAYFSKNSFDFVINCAAYTAVDKAEEDRENAFKVNVTAVRNLATLANKFNYRLIHISTDYIFSGRHFRPYTEEDLPKPSGIYANTKFDAEQIIAELSNNAVILRTSWLYSEFGNNFCKTIIRLAKEKEELRIIADQIGTPTFATDLARAILMVINNYPESDKTELFHFSNQGIASWYDFAHEIISLAKLDCRVTPIRTEEYPLPAPRPFYSVMDKRKFIDTFNTEIPHWKESLKECISIITKT
jgi:dTDP-4-dehydrorhamnose reductase